MFNITIVQINPIIGDISVNKEKMVTAIKRSPGELVIFSEMVLTGYPPRDLLNREWFIESTAEAISALLEESKQWPDKTILFGTPFRSNHNLYNSALLINNGNILLRQDKSLLPSYDVFDENRYFSAASKVSLVDYRGLKLGVSICEDFWNIENNCFQNRYQCNPLSEMAAAGADLFINLSASPFEIGKEQRRRRLIESHIEQHKIPFIMVNQVGGNDDLLFDGKSMVYNNKGQLALQTVGFKEDTLTFSSSQLFEAYENSDHLPQPAQEDISAIHDALVMGIRDYFKKLNFNKALIGLSGGIDSAVVAALAVAALGPDSVLGITMPSMYSSEGSYLDSEELAKKLGIKIQTIKITDIYQAYLTELEPFFATEKPDLTEENIQARIRGNILMAFSNKFGHLVLSTGNKSEVAMGYCTLYGDMSGGLAVISDVPKTSVYKLAHHINQIREVIPPNIINKAPSAELRPDQKDEDSLPPYDILDQVLNFYVEQHFSRNEIIKKGFSEEIVDQVVNAVNHNEYKRKQMPLGLKVTGKAFGGGRRIPIVARFNQ